MTTKKRPVSETMTPYQRLNHLLRKDADTASIVHVCRNFMLQQFEDDIEEGPARPHMADIMFALWTLATKLHAMNREIETLKRRVRREKQHKTDKPQAELLKKTPEPSQPAVF